MKKIFLLLGVSFFSIHSQADRWDAANNPTLISNDFVYDIDALPTESKLELSSMPWSDPYWPNYKGGIAARWLSPTDPFKMPLYTFIELASLTSWQLKTLSPAEKYDILMGRYDYPTVEAERKKNGKNQPEWWGICHGWSTASINHPEPNPISVTNPDGLTIEFGSSDLKALMSYYYGVAGYNQARSQGLVRQVGKRGSAFSGKKDVNPGTFHVVIANLIALKKKGFVADVTAGRQVWNQPVYGFDVRKGSPVEPSQREIRRGIAKKIPVTTRMFYVLETGANWLPVIGTPQQTTKVRGYNYILEIDANNNIIGGEWESKDHPDFLWTHNQMEFTGYFEKLGELVKKATEESH